MSHSLDPVSRPSLFDCLLIGIDNEYNQTARYVYEP